MPYGSGPKLQARLRHAAVLALGAALALAAPAAAAAAEGAPSSAGGVVFVETPAIDKVACMRKCAPKHRTQGGSIVRVVGSALGDVTVATFHGGPRSGDDVRAKVRRRAARRAVLRVPRNAVSGPVSVRTRDAVESPPSDPIDILPPLPPEILRGKDHVFPIRGRHDYGSAGSRFGSARSGHSHQGQDVFARCGTRLVAARGGRVQYRAYHAAAGHYIVIDGAGTRTDYVYMHLARRSPFRRGDRVATGQRIGQVGESGNARGCHLHFEIWTGPGWYQGGHPIDPWRALKAWDRAS